MARRRRRANFTAAEKVAILRRHLLEHVAVSDLCDEHDLQPSQFYTWQKQFFEQGGKAFEGERNGGGDRRLQRRVEALSAKLREKDEVIAEVTQELVRTKKGLGEL
jgi:transposase-like protein